MDFVKLFLVLTSLVSYATPTIIAYKKEDYCLSIICGVLTFFSCFYHKNNEQKFISEDILCSLYTISYIIVNYIITNGPMLNFYYISTFFVGLTFWKKGFRDNKCEVYKYPDYIYHNIWHLITGGLISWAGFSYDKSASIEILEKAVLFFLFFSLVKAILHNYHYLYMSLINSLIVSGIYAYFFLFNYEYTDISTALNFPIDNVAKATNLFLGCYFVADMYYHRREMMFSTTIHHLVSIGIIGLVYINEFHNLAIPFYKYEISTICLNKRRIDKDRKMIYTYIFFVMFFILRVIYFGADIYKLYLLEMFENKLLMVVMPLYLLQIYWFIIMCKILVKGNEN